MKFYDIGNVGPRCGYILATPASALDLNSFRAQQRRPALSVSSTLAGAAYFFSVIPGRGR